MRRVGELEVYDSARFAAAQDNIDDSPQFFVPILLAGIFDELYPQYIFCSYSRQLFLCYFDTIDPGLYITAATHTHTVAEFVYL